MPKISVIVPVYNTEKYLKKCLESIINQTYQDFEIIVVNDGSIDNSEKILLKFKEKYPEKIKYFKKENGGLSDARNFGVQQAKGEYLSFIDSDDYIEKDLFKNLLPYINEKNDLIKFKLIKTDENGQKIEKNSGPTFERESGEEAFNKLCFSDILMEPSCIYLYNTLFFKNNKFTFSKDLYHEDFGLTPLIIITAKSVVSIELYGYYYIQSKNSITRNTDYKKTIKQAYDLLIHYDNMTNYIKNINISINTINNIKQYYTNAILLTVKNLNDKDKKKYISEIKKRDMIKNMKVKNIRQLLKKILLNININLYLKMK